MQDLPVQVAPVRIIEITDAQLADSRHGQINGGRRPQPAGAGNKDRGVF